MTVETEVAALTTAVDNLTSAVNVKKATLDASVADAEAAQSAAASSATTASGHATSAAASASAAASTASGIAGFDLDAIAETKAVTADDVFVYDTSKDSDGGAWRKRCQHTSWYNETLNTATRGGRREFPAVAVIVVDSPSNVTIYDADDPSLPMWMVISTFDALNRRDLGAVEMLNGQLAVATPDNSDPLDGYRGLVLVDFLRDAFKYYKETGASDWVSTVGDRDSFTITDYSDGTEDPSFYKYTGIVNANVNDVAMTVLPGAPVNPATGLPAPTIAVATAGGVSVIKDAGAPTETVVDITGQSNGSDLVAFTESNKILFTDNGTFQHDLWIRDIPDADLAVSSAGDYRHTSAPYLIDTRSGENFRDVITDGENFSGAAFSGVNNVAVDSNTLANGMCNYITSDYNTGWMNGDIKGAFLSDTDTSSLVGANLRTDTFDNVTDWVKVGSASHTLASVSGEAVLTKDATNAGDDQFEVVLTVTTGQRVKVSIDGWRVSGAGAARISMYDNSGTVSLGSSGYAVTSTHERLSAEGVAINGAVRVRLTCGGGAVAGAAGFDNLTVDIADADRSVNNNGLIVNGTVTRSPVATGAELVGYSGFSSSNYLEQPYNSDLDFGTGDFCVMGWVKPASVDADYIFDCRDQTVTPTGFFIYINGSGQPTFYTQGAGSSTLATSSQALSIGSWQYVVGVRHGGINYIYLNGVLTGTTSGATQNVNHTSRRLVVGNSIGLFSYHALQSSLALLRISATAPTAEQIKKIYEDEKVLFQENAAATLYGTSDAVTALAHDGDTNLLHVGTSAGRSVFQGLRRVDNTTTGVTTAISASNGLVVEE